MEVQPAPEKPSKNEDTLVKTTPLEVETPAKMDDELEEQENLLESIKPEPELGLVDAPFSLKADGKIDGAIEETGSMLAIPSLSSVTDAFSGSKDWDWWSTFRSVTEFAAPSAFKKPASRSQLITRLYGNIPYYATNYLMVWCILLMFTVLTSPYLFIAMGFITYGWMWVHRKPSIGCGSLALEGKSKTIFTTAIAALAVMFVAGSSILWIVCLTFALSLLHASMHSLKDSEDPNADIEALEDTAFMA